MGRLAAAQCRALLACLAASALGARAVATECVESPGRVLRACVSVDADGAYYQVFRGARAVIARSALGITFATGSNGAVTRIESATLRESDSEWQQPWGEQRVIRDSQAQLRLSLAGGGQAVRFRRLAG